MIILSSLGIGILDNNHDLIWQYDTLLKKKYLMYLYYILNII